MANQFTKGIIPRLTNIVRSMTIFQCYLINIPLAYGKSVQVCSLHPNYTSGTFGEQVYAFEGGKGANVLPLFYKRGQMSTTLHLLRGQMSSPVNHLGGGGGGQVSSYTISHRGADVQGGGGMSGSPVLDYFTAFKVLTGSY